MRTGSVNGFFGWQRILAGGFFGLLLIGAGMGPSLAAPIEFSATDVNGKVHQLSEERGKWVFINIWATWCPPCRKELPELAAFARAHRDDPIRIWGLSVDTEQSPDEIALFAQSFDLPYPIFKVDPTSLRIFGNIPGIPTTFLINPSGEIVARHVGGVTGNDLMRMIQRNQSNK